MSLFKSNLDIRRINPSSIPARQRVYSKKRMLPILIATSMVAVVRIEWCAQSSQIMRTTLSVQCQQSRVIPRALQMISFAMEP